METTKHLDNALKINELMSRYQQNAPKFQSVLGGLSVDFSNGQSKQSISFSLRMKKGEGIWLSAPLGLAKILLTPEKVQFYNKIDGTYFEGDYALSQRFLGIRLNFEQIENLLLGQMLFPMEGCALSFSQQTYFLGCEQNPWAIQYALNGLFRVQSTAAQAPEQAKSFKAEYTYQQVEQQLFPQEIHLQAEADSQIFNVQMQLTRLQLNKPVTLPYKVPENYSRITFQ